MSTGSTVGLREAKANLSRIVEKVRRGHIVTITVRGKRVARLVPILEDALTVEDRIKDLVDAGLVSSPPRRGKGAPGRFRPLVVEPEGVAQRMLREDRER